MESTTYWSAKRRRLDPSLLANDNAPVSGSRTWIGRVVNGFVSKLSSIPNLLRKNATNKRNELMESGGADRRLHKRPKQPKRNSKRNTGAKSDASARHDSRVPIVSRSNDTSNYNSTKFESRDIEQNVMIASYEEQSEDEEVFQASSSKPPSPDDVIIIDSYAVTSSPQPEQSISRTQSPIQNSSEIIAPVDKWKRRRSADVSWMSRHHFVNNRNTNALKTGKKLYEFAASRNADSNDLLIDISAKDRYRHFLMDLGLDSFSNSKESKGSINSKDQNLRKYDSAEFPLHGKAAFDHMSHTIKIQSPPDSATYSLSTIQEESVRLPAGTSYYSKKVDDSSVPSTSCEESTASAETSVSDDIKKIFDDVKIDQLIANLAIDESSGKYIKDSLGRYRKEAEVRSRRTENLRLELDQRRFAREDGSLSLIDQIRRKLALERIRIRPREPFVDEFPELSNEAHELVRKVWNRHSPLGEKFCEEIVRRDLLTLQALEWLNDEIINYYFKLICERASNNAKLPKVYSFSSFFYSSFLSKGYAAVKRWTRKIDIFSYEIILIPIHLTAHWCLAVVDFTRKVVEYYDSMSQNNDLCLAAIHQYLCEESMDKKQVQLDLSDWQFITRKDIPQQMNGSDCGMFACKFAEYASRRSKIVFTQQDMPYFRKRMVYEICCGKLM